MDEISNKEIRLQVCICTLGKEGLQRIQSKSYPEVTGVEHIILLQDPLREVSQDSVFPFRNDFRLLVYYDKGIARNRNHALETADAPIAMITDDDVAYTDEDYLNVIEAFNNNLDADVISFRYRSSQNPKKYPDHPFYWNKPAKGYYLTAFELAIRPLRIKGKIVFNELFGFNTRYLGGEDDMFFIDLPRKGLTGKFLPIDIGRHDHPTTSKRMASNPLRIKTKAVVTRHAHPFSWVARMILHTIRESGRGKPFTKWQYLRAWLLLK